MAAGDDRLVYRHPAAVRGARPPGPAGPARARRGPDRPGSRSGLVLGDDRRGGYRGRSPGGPYPSGQLARMASARNMPAPPWRTPSSAVTTTPWPQASATMAGSGSETTRTSHTREVDALGRQQRRRLLGGGDHLAHGQQADRTVSGPDPLRACQSRTHDARGHPGSRCLREADHGWSVEGEGLGQHDLDLRAPRRVRTPSCPGWRGRGPCPAPRGGWARRRR